MAKRAPDAVQSIRFELQEKERDLIEQWQYLQTFSSIVDSLSKMKIETLYAWLTILEAFDLVDTPIPTISDYEEIAAAFASWANNRKQRQEERRESVIRTTTAESYTPTGTDPRTSNYDENYNPTDPYDRYTTNPYTGEPL